MKRDKLLKLFFAISLIALTISTFGQTVDSSSTLLQETKVVIYPNPISDYVQINMICTFQILDITGTEVFHAVVHNIKDRFDISSIQPGIYFLVVKKNEEIIATKKIKILD